MKRRFIGRAGVRLRRKMRIDVTVVKNLRLKMALKKNNLVLLSYCIRENGARSSEWWLCVHELNY
jgi:hypothetical protein